MFHKWIPFNKSTENPIVFIHGFLETHTIWYHIPINHLKRPVLLIDVPGFGKSSLLDDNNPSIDYFAEEILCLLNKYDVNSYQVVGHSMGGYIGLEILKSSEKAQKLVLLNSNFWADSGVKKKERTRVADILLKSKNLFVLEAIPNLFIHPGKHSSIIKELTEEAKKGIAEWYAYASLAMRERKDFSDFLKENSARIEIIHGEQDSLIPTKVMEEKCHGWKDFHIVQNSGHMSLFEQPDEVITVLQQLLN